MRQKTDRHLDGAERTIKDIRRKTRKRYSSEEKIRIVLSGLRGEDTGGVTTRTFTHDAAGNMIKDVRGATTYDYVINNAGRISQVKINSYQRPCGLTRFQVCKSAEF